MDPFSMAIFAVSTAASLFGASKKKDAQEEFTRNMSEIDNKKAALSIAQNEAQAARATRDTIRRAQSARGIAVNYGGNSGLMDTSGLSGGLAQISGQQNLTTNAISQDLGRSVDMIDLNSRASQLSGQYSIDQANNDFLIGIGQTVAGSAGQLSRLGRTAAGGVNSMFDQGIGSWSPTVTYG